MTKPARRLEMGPDGFLPFSLPDIGTDEIEAIVEVLRSGWLTTGPRVHEFQKAFATYVGAKRAVAVSSGTAALHLALDSIGLKGGDEVIVPTYTFTASAEVVRYFGAMPILVDVRREDLTIDPAAAEASITNRTRALIGVDLGGVPCEWNVLRGIADAHRLALIDDAAHALPSSLNGKRVGQWADLTAFSFYATKTLTTGEGGMLTANEDALAERAELMCLHGINHAAWNRYAADGGWYYEVIAPGFKYNMTDIAAALGLVQLGRLEEMTVRRSAIASRYTSAFAECPQFELPRIRSDRTTSWHLYVLRLNLDRLRCDRAEFIRILSANKIGSSVHFIPLHLHPYYRELHGYRPEDFPVAYEEYLRVVSLPIYSRMSEADVDRVIQAVCKIAAEYGR